MGRKDEDQQELQENKLGAGVVEIILMLIVLIILVLVFKPLIKEFLIMIFNRISLGSGIFLF